MAAEMARGKRFGIDVTYLAWAHRSLVEFKEALRQVYGPSTLVLRCYFPQTYSSATLDTRFSPDFVPRVATFL